MKLITNNPRLNALANQYAVAVHRHVMQQNKGGQFDFGMNGQASYVAIMGGGLASVTWLTLTFWVH